MPREITLKLHWLAAAARHARLRLDFQCRIHLFRMLSLIVPLMIPAKNAKRAKRQEIFARFAFFSRETCFYFEAIWLFC